MNMKRISIIIVILLCFALCFSYLNKKYDRFYRIAGIDNEKRQLILNHLDEGEQDYLVEHSFSTNRFMKYIEIEEFSLYDLTYYEFMAETERTFLSQEHLIVYTNQLLEKIRSQTNKDVSGHFEQLINYNLDELYLQSETYSLSLTRLYATYKSGFETMKVEDIDRINALNEKMEILDYIDSQKRTFLRNWQSVYSLEALTSYLEMKSETPWIELVEYPESLTAIVDENNVISSYVPDPLTIPYDVSRVSFGMYLRKDACVALEEMVKAFSKEITSETFLLVRAYQSYEIYETSYLDGVSLIRGGQNEFQLGLTIDVSTMNTDYERFNQTALCQYLKENSWKFGFIQRYSDVEDETYNEHIYRYVGKQAAKLIYEKQISLEEYEGV